MPRPQPLLKRLNCCASPRQVSVDLPKKHGRGGQSALRFARLRMEKRHNYVRKVAELAVQVSLTLALLLATCNTNNWCNNSHHT